MQIDYEKEFNNCIELLGYKDQEIARQISKRRLAEQVRNWIIILSVVINILIWIF